MNIKDIKFGKSIINTIHLNKHSDIQLINIIIDFYALSLDLYSALNVFNNINNTNIQCNDNSLY